MDVLTDDLTATAQEKDKAQDVPLNPPPAEQKAEPKAEPKPAPAKPQKQKPAKAKAVRAAKPAKAKKAKHPPKPAVKQPAKPVAKYEVKENGKGDAHDKLKPRANPVPVVKVLPVAPVKTVPAEEPAETAVAEARTAPAEPVLSKHFLEQQARQENEERASRERAAKVLEVLMQSRQEAAAEQPSEKTAAAVPSKADEAVKWSVFPVVKKMTPKERSAFLVKEVPADSATAKAVLKNKDLRTILVFRDGSVDLTDEMRAEAQTLAKEAGKTKNSRILLLSYSRPSEQRSGGERQLSLRRALAVRSALARAGVSSLRIEIRSQAAKGAGEKLPDRVDILVDG